MERIFYALGGLVLLSGVTLTALAPTDLMASREAFFARLGILGPSVISSCLLIAIGYVIQLLKAIRDHLAPKAASGSLLSPLTGAVTGAVASAGSHAGNTLERTVDTVGDTGKAAATVVADTATTIKDTGAKAVDTGASAIGTGTAAVIAGGAAIGAVAASVLHSDAEADTAPETPVEPVEVEAAAHAPQAEAMPDLTSYLDSLLNPVTTAAPAPPEAVRIEEAKAEEATNAEPSFESDDFTFDLSDLTPSSTADAPVETPVYQEAPVHFDDDALSRAMTEALNAQDNQEHYNQGQSTVETAAEEPAAEQVAEAPVPSMATPVLDADDTQRAPTVEEYLGRSEPAPEADIVEAPRTVVREGQFAGRRYRMFEDGSLEIDTEQSTIKFASLDDFRAFVSAASTKA